MKNISLKALGAFIFAAGLVVAGVALPAQALSLTSPSATSTGTIGTSGTNAYDIVVTATSASPAGTVPNINSDFDVYLPTGWSFVNTFGGPTCNSSITYTGLPSIIGCSTSNQNPPHVEINYGSNNSPLGIPAGTTISVTFPAGTLNVATARVFTITTQVTGSIVDMATATLASATPSYAIGYNRNGGNGGSVTSPSTSSGSLTLPANGFTKTGSTFSGWRVGNATSGTIYQPGDTVTITGAVLVYAQWTDNSAAPATDSSNTLANTGISSATGMSLLAGGLSLALVGAEMFMIARRKRSN